MRWSIQNDYSWLDILPSVWLELNQDDDDSALHSALKRMLAKCTLTARNVVVSPPILWRALAIALLVMYARH